MVCHHLYRLEEKIKQECEQRRRLDFTLCSSVVEEKIKYKGQWHIQKKKLFPDICFLYQKIWMSCMSS